MWYTLNRLQLFVLPLCWTWPFSKTGKKVHLANFVGRYKPQVDFNSITDSNRFVSWLWRNRGLGNPLCSWWMRRLGKGRRQRLLEPGWRLFELRDCSLQDFNQIQAGTSASVVAGNLVLPVALWLGQSAGEWELTWHVGAQCCSQNPNQSLSQLIKAKSSGSGKADREDYSRGKGLTQ